MATVGDCERVQTDWFRYRAVELGGTVWDDDGTLWTDGPDGMNLMFPRRVSRPAVDRAVERARALGRNRTPVGRLLYRTCGFAQIGAGITWWLHLADG